MLVNHRDVGELLGVTNLGNGDAARPVAIAIGGSNRRDLTLIRRQLVRGSLRGLRPIRGVRAVESATERRAIALLDSLQRGSRGDGRLNIALLHILSVGGLTGRVQVLVVAFVESLTDNALTERNVVGGTVNGDRGGCLTHRTLVNAHVVFNVRVVERTIATKSVHALVDGEHELTVHHLRGADLLDSAIKCGSLKLNAVQAGREL